MSAHEDDMIDAGLSFNQAPSTTPGDGWVEWTGGDCPARGQIVDVVTRGTGEWSGWTAEQWGQSWLVEAYEDPDNADAIIAYRLARPTQPEPERDGALERANIAVASAAHRCDTDLISSKDGLFVGDLRTVLSLLSTAERQRDEAVRVADYVLRLFPSGSDTKPDSDVIAFYLRMSELRTARQALQSIGRGE